MYESEEKPTLSDAKMAVVKLLGLNELFIDSVVYNKCECYHKYKYVANQNNCLIWTLVEYFDIDI